MIVFSDLGQIEQFLKMGDNRIEEEDRKLFVGGLAQECTQDDLKVLRIITILFDHYYFTTLFILAS